MRPPLEVADIFRQCGNDFRLTHTLSPEQRRVMRAIERCRTAALGGHVEQCDTCGHQRISYNSCRNRHCPKCQSLAKARWLEARLADLLPVEYFHVVFTLPEQLASVALQNKRVVYNLLFASTAETLRTIAADPRHLGAEIGFLAVLHTWGQTLGHHPHLHCVILGGGLSADGAFRRLFLQGLERAYENDKLGYSMQARQFRSASYRPESWI
jgi:transposase-like zinc-binding protein/putative transposase